MTKHEDIQKIFKTFRIDKLTGALYLGELVRRVLSQLCLDGHLFDGQPCERLELVDSFPTKYILEILASVHILTMFILHRDIHYLTLKRFLN